MTRHTAVAVDDAVTYFRGDPAWADIFHRVRERLAQLGRVGGTITLEAPATVHAVESVGCPVRRGRVDLTRLDAELRSGRFPSGLWATVEVYFGAPLTTRSTIRAEAAAIWERVADGWSATVVTSAAAHRLPMEDATRLGRWLADSSAVFRRHWHADAAGTRDAVDVAIRAAAAAPGSTEAPCALPVFALQQTGDPHGFDQDRAAGRYLLPALAARFLGDAARARGDATERDLVLAAAGLSSDGISSIVTCASVVGGGMTLEAARLAGEVLALPLITVQGLHPVGGTAGRAFVVENPAVFVSLWRRLRGVLPLERPTLVCSSGQLSLAALMLLDRLVDAGTVLAYSGDFDGMGLRIAARLLRRYGDRCTLWRMSVPDYREALLARPAGLDQSAIDVGDLPEIPDALRTCVAVRGAAYQESLIDDLARDILAHAGLASA